MRSPECFVGMMALLLPLVQSHIYRHLVDRKITGHVLLGMRPRKPYNPKQRPPFECLFKCHDKTHAASCKGLNVDPTGYCELVTYNTTDPVTQPEIGSRAYKCVPECPDNFGFLYENGQLEPSGSFKPTCYHFNPKVSNTSVARSRCQYLGGDLISVESPGELSHIINVLQQNPHLAAADPLYKDNQYWGYWTSGMDKVEGVWVWEATGLSFPFSSWGGGQPNDGGIGQDCMILARRYGYSWSDEGCELSAKSTLCEITADC